MSNIKDYITIRYSDREDEVFATIKDVQEAIDSLIMNDNEFIVLILDKHRFAQVSILNGGRYYLEYHKDRETNLEVIVTDGNLLHLVFESIYLGNEKWETITEWHEFGTLKLPISVIEKNSKSLKWYDICSRAGIIAMLILLILIFIGHNNPFFQHKYLMLLFPLFMWLTVLKSVIKIRQAEEDSYQLFNEKKKILGTIAITIAMLFITLNEF